jgi:hypothetical protein
MEGGARVLTGFDLARSFAFCLCSQSFWLLTNSFRRYEISLLGSIERIGTRITLLCEHIVVNYLVYHNQDTVFRLLVSMACKNVI